MATGMTRTGGYNNYNSEGTSKFVPQVWTKKVLRNFYLSTVFGQIANTDYEGEIKSQGDKVLIRRTPEIDINPYTVGSTLTYQVPEVANTELVIDQAQSWSFRIDDIDKLESDLNLMNMFTKDAGERLKITIDADMLQYIATRAAATNVGITAGAISGDIDMGAAADPRVITSGNQMATALIDANQVLDEADIPNEGRWVVLPAWACALLKDGDLKRADVTGDSTGVIRTGLIGTVDKFKIYQSNNIYNVTDGNANAFYMPFGTSEAITFASQLTKTENIRIPDSFGDYFRGLQVYGRKVVQPSAMGVLYGSKVAAS